MIDFLLEKKLHGLSGELLLSAKGSIQKGEFISLFGASGTGKTSLLRLLAGLMPPGNGFIRLNNESWYDHEKNIHVAAQKRKIGFVFQDQALFPNMSVRQNIDFAAPKNGNMHLTDELLELTGLQNLSGRRIQSLSGGQRQRVALARAIASKPVLLLLDEPLSAIDNEARLQLQDVLQQLHQRYMLTTILVTHDVAEIVKLSDRIFQLQNGQLLLHESPQQFLKDTGIATTVQGTVLSVDGSHLMVFVQQAVLQIPVAEIKANAYAKGTIVQIMYDKDGRPVIQML